MDTEQLRTALHGATATLEPRPGLTERIVTGGKRRARRRRIKIAVSAVTAAVAAVMAGTVGWQYLSGPVVPAADRWLFQPTRGDLAQDTTFLRAAIGAWQENWQTRLSGHPHAYWAGRIPSGRIVVVVQQTDVGTVAGVVGDNRIGQLQVLVVDDPGAAPLGVPAFRIGDKANFLVAPDPGKPMYASGDVAYGGTDTPNPTATRTWTPMSVADGLATLQLAEARFDMHPRVLTADPADGVHVEDVVKPLSADRVPTSQGPRWATGDRWAYWAGAEPERWNQQWTVDQFQAAVARARDPAAGTVTEGPEWYVSFGTPDGTPPSSARSGRTGWSRLRCSPSPSTTRVVSAEFFRGARSLLTKSRSPSTCRPRVRVWPPEARS